MDFVAFACPVDQAVNQWAAQINTAAIKADIPPCFLAAIVYRESKGINRLQIGYSPGPGCGVGLTQITYNVNWANPERPSFNGYQLLYPPDNLWVAANFFIAPAIGECKQAQEARFNDFKVACKGQVLYGAAAAYNGGWGLVQSALDKGYDCDRYTTRDENGPYAADTFNRYLFYIAQSHAAQEKS